MIGRAARTGLGLTLGGFTSLRICCSSHPAVALLVPAARLPVGLLGAAVLGLLAIGVTFAATMLVSWVTGTPWMLEREPSVVVSGALVAYYTVPGAALLYVGLTGAAGVARWERSLLARLLALAVLRYLGSRNRPRLGRHAAKVHA